MPRTMVGSGLLVADETLDTALSADSGDRKMPSFVENITHRLTADRSISDNRLTDADWTSER